jgi:membrane protein implicated in regulation of membrane protease activity
MDPWLIWFLAGLALIVTEFFLPGIILVFFGLAASAVSLLAFFGVVGSVAIQLTLFAIGSLLLTACFRQAFLRIVQGSQRALPGGSDEQDEFTGKPVRVITAFSGPGAMGKVEFKGAEWKARAEEALHPGDTAEIVSVDGLTLNIRKQWLTPFP